MMILLVYGVEALGLDKIIYSPNKETHHKAS